MSTLKFPAAPAPPPRHLRQRLQPTSSNGFPTTPSYSSSGSVSPGAVSPSNSLRVSAAVPRRRADTLYSNGLRDITSGKYDLARSEFQDYLRFYGTTDLASNAQFYLGEIAYSQKNYDLAVSEYDKVLTGYPRSFKTAPARLKKALANIELGQKATGVRELREIVKKYPGTEEDRRARAKLKEMGAALSASRSPTGPVSVLCKCPATPYPNARRKNVSIWYPAT